MNQPQPKESTRRPSRSRDPRMDDRHSQKQSYSSSNLNSNLLSGVSPPPSRTNPSILLTSSPKSTESSNPASNLESLAQDSQLESSTPPTYTDSSILKKEDNDLLHIARLSVLTKAKKMGCISAPVLQHALEKTIGSPVIFSYMSSISVLLDQELRKKRST